MAPPIPLGPFDLLAPLGQGGMGVVYRGVHRAQGLPVAVKVLGVEQAGDAFNLACFRNEIRLVAGLDHPGIVRVFDHRALTAEAAAASGGALVPGSPYLVMELVPGGDLHALCGSLGWTEVRRVLLDLLDALGHAHARGVLHLDLKPGNVLVDADGTVKLTDFGLGLAIDRASETGRAVAGTPAYMAPEQVRGRWRDFGPWTDLYAVGCLAYALVAGRPPFAHSTTPGETLEAQLNQQPGPLPAAVDAPAGFSPWLAALLAKPPGERFRRAADAACALAELPAVGAPPAAPAPAAARPDVTLADDLTLADVGPEPDGPPAPSAAPPPRPPAPLPPTWRPSRAPAPPSSAPRDAGLGLFELRTAPFVDREAERDALWAALAAVHATGRPHLMVLAGPSGCGKSRLARWLCERAHETGGATVLQAAHGPALAVGHGLGPMVARHLRCDGLTGGPLLAHLAQRLAPVGLDGADDRAAVAELVAPAEGAAAASTVRFQSPRERYTLVVRLLRALARARPLVVWLDDVQWGGDTLRFVQHALDAAGEAPVPALLLATARAEALAERPAESALLERLLARPEATRVDLTHLADGDTQALLGGLLPLAPPLLAEVSARVQGNPLFAVQLLGDWVERRLLVAGPAGFALAEAAPGLPDDLHTVWRERVARVLRERPAGHRDMLEVAAVLGTIVDDEEWAAACVAGGLGPPPPDLLDVLLDQRLAVREGHGEARWSLVHGMLRESIARAAEEGARAAGHHRACAAALAGRAHAERVAHHLLAAGETEAAIEPLAAAAQARFFEGEYGRAEAVLARLDQALSAVGAPAADERWGTAWVLRAEVALRSGRTEDALAWAQRATEVGEARDWGLARVRALELRGRLAGLQGRPDDARRDFEAGLSLAEARAEPVAGARCARALGLIAMEQGRLDEARAHLERAQAAFAAHGAERDLASCSLILGRAAIAAWRVDEAELHYRRAREAYQREGSRWGAAEALSESGDVHRFRGEPEKAAAVYQEAMERLGALDSTDAWFARLNLGVARLESGRPAEARVLVRDALRRLAGRGVHVGDAQGHTALCACAASEGDWGAFDGHFAEATAKLAASGYTHPDIARLLELAAGWAEAAGQAARAEAARALAEGHRVSRR